MRINIYTRTSLRRPKRWKRKTVSVFQSFKRNLFNIVDTTGEFNVLHIDLLNYFTLVKTEIGFILHTSRPSRPQTLAGFPNETGTQSTTTAGFPYCHVIVTLVVMMFAQG